MRLKMPRYLAPNLLFDGSVGVLVKKEDRQKIIEAISNEVRNGSEKTAELAVVNEVRRLAKTQKTVGEDCMCVRINFYAHPQVCITYQKSSSRKHRKSKTPSNISGRTGMIIQVANKSDPIPKMPPNIEEIEGVFSPWIISSNQALPPSYIVGQLNIRSDNINIHIDGLPLPDNNDGIIGGSLSQNRPILPK